MRLLPIRQIEVGWSSIMRTSPSPIHSFSTTVPFTRQAFGQGNGTWDYSSQSVGIDGVGDNDLMQAGTEMDAYA